MRTSGDGRRRHATGWCGRLLLFTALLLGIVTMHTLGHPSSGHGSAGDSPAAHAPHTALAAHDSPAAQGPHRPDTAPPAHPPLAAQPSFTAHSPLDPPAPEAPPTRASALPDDASPASAPHGNRTQTDGTQADGTQADGTQEGGPREDGVHTDGAAPAEAGAAQAGNPSAPAEKPHGLGTDPMSVCLAVLAAWPVLALLGALTLLASLWSAVREPLTHQLARIRRALRPVAPPGRTALRLAQLSILRI